MPSSGRTSLRRVLSRLSGAEVAARCRVYRSSVSRWASGETLPSAEHQRILAEHCGVHGTWDEPVGKVRGLEAVRRRR